MYSFNSYLYQLVTLYFHDQTSGPLEACNVRRIA